MPYFRGTTGNDYFATGTFQADTFDLLAGHDTAFGGEGGDTMNGHAGNDWIFGQGGSDKLYGGADRDYLSGGNGSDLLVGGSGADRLAGGFGADTFRMDYVSDARWDRIYDFRRGEGDRIDLRGIDADSTGLFNLGNESFTFIHNDPFYGKKQLRYWFDGVDTHVQGNTNGDLAPEFDFVLSGKLDLRAGDFYL